MKATWLRKGVVRDERLELHRPCPSRPPRAIGRYLAVSRPQASATLPLAALGHCLLPHIRLGVRSRPCSTASSPLTRLIQLETAHSHPLAYLVAFFHPETGSSVKQVTSTASSSHPDRTAL